MTHRLGSLQDPDINKGIWGSRILSGTTRIDRPRARGRLPAICIINTPIKKVEHFVTAIIKVTAIERENLM